MNKFEHYSIIHQKGVLRVMHWTLGRFHFWIL